MSSTRNLYLSPDKSAESLAKYSLSYEEYSVHWKNIIFLPFNHNWQLMIVCVVVIEIFTLIYDSIYDINDDNQYALSFIIYSMEFPYIVDTLLLIAHKNMPQYRKIREHKPKSSVLLLIDVITILPIYQMYVLVKTTSQVQGDPTTRIKIWAIHLARVNRIFSYFLEIKNRAAANHVFIVIVGQILSLTLITHFVGALWYYIGCWKCETKNWTAVLEGNMIFLDHIPHHWLTICYVIIGNVLFNNWRGQIAPVTPTERLIVIVTMLVGFFLHMMLYFGKLTGAYVKKFRPQHLFVENLKDISRCLKHTKAANKWKTKAKEFYSIYWQKRSGIKSMPEMFNILPISMQKEVGLDIFWEALRHSHLFGMEDTAFKRALSMEMRNEFLLPGDYLFKMNEMRTKMVYVVSGVVQLLTAEDEESPIMSFSSGTILGEMSCIMPTKSSAYVQCATYCEIQTLSIDKMYAVLRSFPHKTRRIHLHLFNRIKNAREVYAFKQTRMQQKLRYFRTGNEDTSIKWIKMQWRSLSNTKRLNKKSEVSLNVDPCHISRYLDLLVLSDEVELKMQVICLRGSCPFVLEPDSSFRWFTHYLVLAAAIIQSIILPFIIAFTREVTDGIFVLFFFLDLIYVLDIYLKLSTAIKTKDVLVSNSIAIIFWRVKEISFLIDILATIPVDYILLTAGFSLRTFTLLKLNRLFKILDVVHYINYAEANIWLGSVRSRFLKHCFMYLFGSYWFACLMFTLTCFHDTCTSFGWYNKLMSTEWYIKFIRSLFYSCTAFVKMGTSGSFERILTEFMVQHVVVAIGYHFFIYFLSQMSATFILLTERKETYRKYCKTVTEFMHRNRLPVPLKTRITNILLFAWYYNKNVKIFGEGGVLEDANNELKDKLVGERIKRCLRRVPLFSNLDEITINRLVEVAELRTLPSDAILLSPDVRPVWLHVILSGYCSVTSIMPGDNERNATSILKFGDAYPVVEVLQQVISLVSVKSITAIEIISIGYYDLKEILLGDTIVYADDIKRSLELHFLTYKSALLRKKGRLPEMIPAEHSLGRGDLFTYEIHDDLEESSEDADYLGPFRALGKWGFLRYFLFRNTIDPHSRFFITWEIFKSSLAIIRTFLGLTYFNLLMGYSYIIRSIVRVIDLICLIDIYIRMHCHYYNKEAILVTHPWYTAKHYVRTSFGIDVFSFLPFRLLKLDELIGSSNRELLNYSFILISRPWHVHRLISALNYLQSDIFRKVVLLQTIKYVVLVSVLICTLTSFIQLISCKITPQEVICNEFTWIKHTYYKGPFTPISVYMQCLHIVVSFFTSTGCGNLKVVQISDGVMFMIMYLLFFVVRWFITSKLISLRIGGSTLLEVYHERVKNFKDFIENELVDEETVNQVLESYNYHWKKVLDEDVVDSLRQKMHPHLHQDICYFLYGPTLEAVEAFHSADSSFHRQLSVFVKPRHFKKDAEIIRCNDVQGLIYIVYRGKVDIIAAGTKLTTLDRGGMFGCLEPCNTTRQTINAVARVHVQLLVISNKDFYELCHYFKDILQSMQQLIFTHSEYVDNKRRVAFETKSSILSTRDKSNTSVLSSLMRIYHKCQFLIRHRSSWYRKWDYVTSVHLASLSSISFMFYIFIARSQTGWIANMEIFLVYVLDIIFITGIVFKLHLTFTDPDSGITIRDLSTIRTKYIKSYKFWLDVFACLPFEIITMLITSNTYLIRYTMANRIFRLLYLNRYYSKCKEQLDVPLHLRWAYLIYWGTISIQMMTCLWWLAACIRGSCYYNSASFKFDKRKVLKGKPGMESTLLAYTYVINLLTGTKLADVGPRTLTQLLISVVIMGGFQFTLMVLSSEFVTLLSIGQHAMNDYEYKLQQFQTYMQSIELSPSIVNKVWNYSLILWKLQRGETIPRIIKESPAYLKQDIMTALYGHHLRKHYLFMNTHVDFLRQLVVHLKRYIFFAGNHLAEVGDIDESMYFVHKGQVEVYEKHGNYEMQRIVLHAGDSFGEAQGLYSNTHNLCYKAQTVVDVLVLKRSDWTYLLEWFPASYQEIHRKAAAHGLRKISKADMV